MVTVETIERPSRMIAAADAAALIDEERKRGPVAPTIHFHQRGGMTVATIRLIRED